MEYLDLFKKLDESDVRYLICGGLAVNIYGIPRMTADIDLLIDFEKKNISAFENAVAILQYKPVLPLTLAMMIDKDKRDALVKEKNLIAFSYFNLHSNVMNVDVLIDTPFSFEEMWRKKEARQVENVTLYLVSVEYLIEMKNYSGRVQDKQDVIQLSKFIRK